MKNSSLNSIPRRRLLLQGAAASAAIALPSFAVLAQAPARQLRIGKQKGLLSILKGRGTLEKRLAPLGVSVKWTEFTAGPVQLEALNVGSIDFGDVGETPPIFTQAADAPLAYLAATVQRAADRVCAGIAGLRDQVRRAHGLWNEPGQQGDPGQTAADRRLLLCARLDPQEDPRAGCRRGEHRVRAG